MDVTLERTRPQIGRLYWLWGPTLLLAVIAGCAQPPKAGAAKLTTPQAAEKTTPAKPAPAARKANPGKGVEPAVKLGPAPAEPDGAPSASTDPARKEGCSTPATPKAPAAPKAPATDLTPPPADQPQPKAVCKQTKVVVDPIWQGKLAEFTFTISNEGQAPLAIRVKPTWKTKVSGQSDRTIQPGQSEQIVLNVGTGPMRGKLTKSVFVATNDRENPTVRLDCETEIRSALKCDPERADLGRITRNQEKAEKTVRITRGAGGPLKPRIATTTNPKVTAELREVEAGEAYDLIVSAQPPWPNGTLRANVQIETGVEQVPLETVMVMASVAPRLQAVPARFTIRPDQKSGVRLVAKLAWDDSQPGQATEAAVSDPSLVVRLEQQGDQQVVVLNVPTDYSPQPGKSIQITVRTDDPDVPFLTIPVTALPAPPGGSPPAPAASAGRPGASPTAPGGPAAATPVAQPPAGGARPQ